MPPATLPIAQIPPPPLQGFEIGPLDIRVYGILIATAVLVAATWTRRRYARFGGDAETADNVIFWAVVLGFLGARIGYVIPRVGRFVDDPLSVLAIWEGGLALFGGLSVGLVALVVGLRRTGGDLPAFTDALAPALPAAQAIGRWGNYFNQELYGTPTDLPWAVEIEPAFRLPAFADSATFHPTFLYESLGNVLLVVALLAVERTGRLRRGALLPLYAVGYGLLRFSLELIRTDTTFRVLGLSRNAYVALAFVVAGALIVRMIQRRPAALPGGGEPEVVTPEATGEAEAVAGEEAPQPAPPDEEDDEVSGPPDR